MSQSNLLRDKIMQMVKLSDDNLLEAQQRKSELERQRATAPSLTLINDAH